MLRRGLQRFNWHGLQEFALQESDAAAFRVARNADAVASEAIATAAVKQAPIDWAKYQNEIRHQDLVTTLKAYHDQQIKLLDSLLSEDHSAAVAATHKKSWDDVFQSAVSTATKSVEKSEDIVANGAKALYISYNNPPINTVSTSEWLDTDQYWQAFVEKHQYYHNHLDCATEDPESKEYDDKMKSELMKNFKLHDETHPRADLLYQRPSYKYYSYFKGPLVEHMMFYLVKTGGDARMFPELLPHKWFDEIYAVKWKLLECLQRRRRQRQLETLEREVDLEFTPHDMALEGEAYYSKLIQKENANVENQVARLMGNFMFLSEGVGVQTSAALFQIINSEAEGTFYTLGDDVNALFFVPKAGGAVSPQEAAASYLDHLSMTGKKLPPAFAIALEEFATLLEQRKAAMSGSWFNVPNETQAEAFVRRVKVDDPLKPVYEEYAEELKARWAEKTEVSQQDAVKKIAAIEAHYNNVELPAYEDMIFGSENPESKAAVDKLSKLEEAGNLAGALESGEVMAFDNNGKPMSADDLKKLLK